VVRKVERQYTELEGTTAEPLKVNEKKVYAYVKKFNWDIAQYQYQGKPLLELVGQVQSLTSKIEDELKNLSTTFSEKNQALAAIQRKKIINLTTSDFEDFLRPEDVAKIDFLNTESLLTVTVVVPKSLDHGKKKQKYLNLLSQHIFDFKLL
jgi:predicted nuclease with TOPRIM domain